MAKKRRPYMNPKIKDLCVEALRKAGLDQQQIRKTLPVVYKNAQYVARHGGWQKHSSYWDFDQKITKTARLLGIPKAKYLKAAITKPSLFTHAPKSVNFNVETAASLLGLKKEVYLAKGPCGQPQLFYMSPYTIFKNIKETAELLDVEFKDHVQAALHDAALFYRSPKTIAAHGLLMLEFNRLGIIKPSVKKLFATEPRTLCRSKDNLMLRLVYAKHVGLKGEDNFRLIRRSRQEIEQDFVKVLGHDPTKKIVHCNGSRKRKDRVLRHLIETGLIQGYTLENV